MCVGTDDKQDDKQDDEGSGEEGEMKDEKLIDLKKGLTEESSKEESINENESYRDALEANGPIPDSIDAETNTKDPEENTPCINNADVDSAIDKENVNVALETSVDEINHLQKNLESIDESNVSKDVGVGGDDVIKEHTDESKVLEDTGIDPSRMQLRSKNQYVVYTRKLKNMMRIAKPVTPVKPGGKRRGRPPKYPKVLPVVEPKSDEDQFDNLPTMSCNSIENIFQTNDAEITTNETAVPGDSVENSPLEALNSTTTSADRKPESNTPCEVIKDTQDPINLPTSIHNITENQLTIPAVSDDVKTNPSYPVENPAQEEEKVPSHLEAIPATHSKSPAPVENTDDLPASEEIPPVTSSSTVVSVAISFPTPDNTTPEELPTQEVVLSSYSVVKNLPEQICPVPAQKVHSTPSNFPIPFHKDFTKQSSFPNILPLEKSALNPTSLPPLPPSVEAAINPSSVDPSTSQIKVPSNSITSGRVGHSRTPWEAGAFLQDRVLDLSVGRTKKRRRKNQVEPQIPRTETRDVGQETETEDKIVDLSMR